MEYLIPIFTLLVGAIVGWFWANKKAQEAAAEIIDEHGEQLEGLRNEHGEQMEGLRRNEATAREELARLEVQLEEREKAADREKEFMKESLEKMGDKFKALAGEALKSNNEQFLEKADFKLNPLNEALRKLDEKTRDLEGKREKAYGALSQQILDMNLKAEGMVKSSEQMASLLKGSNQVRGNWGEMLLRNVVEFAGMEEHVHFEEQSTIEGGNRPDMIIKLPGKAGIPVDSKCPFASYQAAREIDDPSQIDELMKQHARDVQTHVRTLAKKDYSSSIEGDVDFTVMFMPGDHLLEAALAVNPGLQDEALKQKILITNPVSLVALLRTVRVYWSQEETNRNAQHIADAARDLYDRVVVYAGHMAKIGKGVKTALDAHNSAVGSFQRKVLPAGKRIQELKVPGTDLKPLDDNKIAPQEIEGDVREMEA